MKGRFHVRPKDAKDMARARVIDRLLNYIWPKKYNISFRDDTKEGDETSGVRRVATGVKLVSRNFIPIK
jgi:hypothetical protein